MQKKSLILLSFVLSLASVNAFTATLSEINLTLSEVSISQANNLYAYEINFEYSGAVDVLNHINFFSSCSASSQGDSTKSNILSVYSSCLQASHLGVNGSGSLFNVSYSDSLSLLYTLAVYANGTEEYIYYNGSEPIVNPGTGGGGGSGSGGGATSDQFDVSPNLIKVEVNQGETKTEIFTLTNKLETSLNITSITADDNIKQFTVFDYDSIYLLPSESKTIEVHFFAKTDEIPEVYTGRIIVKSAGTTKTINVIIEVKEDQPLFDVTIDLEKDVYSAGENVIGVIEVENFGDLRDIDILLYYAIKDFEGNVTIFKEVSLAIENYKLQYIGRLKLPQDIPPEKYLFYAKASYGDIIATGSQPFTVSEVGLGPGIGTTFLYIMIFSILVAIIIITIILYFALKKPTQAQHQPIVNIQ